MESMPRPSQDWIRDFLATPVLHEPGSAFFYNSAGSTLLAAMVRTIVAAGRDGLVAPYQVRSAGRGTTGAAGVLALVARDPTGDLARHGAAGGGGEQRADRVGLAGTAPPCPGSRRNQWVG